MQRGMAGVVAAWLPCPPACLHCCIVRSLSLSLCLWGGDADPTPRPILYRRGTGDEERGRGRGGTREVDGGSRRGDAKVDVMLPYPALPRLSLCVSFSLSDSLSILSLCEWVSERGSECARLWSWSLSLRAQFPFFLLRVSVCGGDPQWVWVCPDRGKGWRA